MNVIQGGVEAFNMFSYGETPQNTRDYFLNEIQGAPSNMVANAGNAFVSSLKDLYEKFHGSETVQMAKQALSKVTGLFMPEIIIPLATIEQFQNATMTMQRWVMAHEGVRALYQEGRVDGYSDTYVDVEPDTIGKTNYDYRLVMDGIVTVDDEGCDTFTFYQDPLRQGDQELTHYEKVDIIRGWHALDVYLNGEDDPTAAYGGKL